MAIVFSSSRRPMSPRMQFFFGRFFPWPFILLGGAMAFIGVRDFIRARESVDWPTVSGQVVHSQVTWSVSDGTNSRSTTYRADVLYDYKLSGRIYSSNRVAFGNFSSNDPSDAQIIVDRYPARTLVEVHYDPQSPELAVLEAGVHGGTYLALLLGAGFFALGCGLLFWLPQRMRQAAATAAPAGEETS